MLILFLKGLVLGLGLAAPVGPVNLLCMKRSLDKGWGAGLITGLGAATADTFYGSVAAFSLTFITSFLETYKAYLSMGGGVFFFGLGALLILSRKTKKTADVSGANAYFSTVLLTLSNPATVFSFLAAFAAVKLNTHEGGEVKIEYAAFATAGVFCGSMLWWTFLSWISSRFRKSLSDRAVHRINVAAGVLLLIFGAFVFSRGVAALSS